MTERKFPVTIFDPRYANYGDLLTEISALQTIILEQDKKIKSGCDMIVFRDNKIKELEAVQVKLAEMVNAYSIRKIHDDSWVTTKTPISEIIAQARRECWISE